nr:unnamed protein product [Callosobruchus chinensis]
MKEQLTEKKNLLKKNEQSIAKVQQQHKAAMREFEEKHDRRAALKDGIRRLKEKLEKVTVGRHRKLEEENKELKLDLNNVLDDAKESTAELSKTRGDDMESENARLKKELQKADSSKIKQL